MQIAIIALSPTGKDAPYTDDAWTTYGLGVDTRAELYDLVFEMHPWEKARSVYHARMKEVEETMSHKLITHDNYPFDEVEKLWPHGFDSSAAYMLGRALLENPDRIGLWGLDMAHGGEYAFQRDNFNRMIGFAMGRGIEFVYPPGCKLKLPVRYYPNFDMDHNEVTVRFRNMKVVRA